MVTARSIMFLGGPLDHTTRVVPVSPRNFLPEQFHQASGGVYELTEVRSGEKVWWIYILVGYDPPVGHVINTMPARLNRQEAPS